MAQPPLLNDEVESAVVSGSGETATGKSGTWQRVVNSRGAMLAMLFCVTGVLGVPFLWKSQAFSAAEKVVWSVVVTVYTCLLLWGTAAILMWSYRTISSALGW